MQDRFEVFFLKGAFKFLEGLEEKIQEKILFNIDKAKKINDPELFKKLHGEIWEFRTKYQNLQYRLFAFWDKEDNNDTLVIATHGLIKKTDKVPQKEIEKAEKIRQLYFEEKK